MTRRSLIVLLILFLLEIFLFGCVLTNPFFPVHPTQTAVLQTATPNLTAGPYGSGVVRATGQSMKETVFAQVRIASTPVLFREHVNPFDLLSSLPGLLMFVSGVVFTLYYGRVRRRRWAAGVSFHGFQAHVGVVRGKPAVRGAKMDFWLGWLFLVVGFFSMLFGILYTMLN